MMYRIDVQQKKKKIEGIFATNQRSMYNMHTRTVENGLGSPAACVTRRERDGVIRNWPGAVYDKRVEMNNVINTDIEAHAYAEPQHRKLFGKPQSVCKCVFQEHVKIE